MKELNGFTTTLLLIAAFLFGIFLGTKMGYHGPIEWIGIPMVVLFIIGGFIKVCVCNSSSWTE